MTNQNNNQGDLTSDQVTNLDRLISEIEHFENLKCLCGEGKRICSDVVRTFIRSAYLAGYDARRSEI